MKFDFIHLEPFALKISILLLIHFLSIFKVSPLSKTSGDNIESLKETNQILITLHLPAYYNHSGVK